MRIVLPGSGSVRVKSADDPDALRGVGLDGVVLDESAFMQAAAWVNGIRPALSDRQGWALFLTTPNGMNWIHGLYETAGRAGLPVRELQADRDKVARAYPLAAALEGGRILLPRSAPWLRDLEHELLAFPLGRHDDQVDCLAYALRMPRWRSLVAPESVPVDPWQRMDDEDDQRDEKARRGWRDGLPPIVDLMDLLDAPGMRPDEWSRRKRPWVTREWL